MSTNPVSDTRQLTDYRFENGDQTNNNHAIVMLRADLFQNPDTLEVTVNREAFRYITLWSGWHIYGGDKPTEGYPDANISVLKKEWVRYTNKPENDGSENNGEISSIETSRILWRGVSETNTAALIYPPSYGQPGAVLQNESGNTLAEASFTGLCEESCTGSAAIWYRGAVYRFQQRGSHFPRPVILVAGERKFLIPDPGREYDPR